MKSFPSLIVLSLLALSTRAASPFGDAEHVLYVHIDSTPSGASVLSVPAREGEEANTIGRTPLVVPVDMKWGRSYLAKDWAKLRINTRGNVATNEYDPSDKTHAIFLTFALEKDGYARQVVREVATVLSYDKEPSWDDLIDDLPGKRTYNFALTPIAPATNAATSAAPAIPTVIMAAGDQTSADTTGYLLVEGPAGALVFLDGIQLGKAPLRLMLPEGEHQLTTMRDGKLLPAKSAPVAAGKTSSATLP